MNATDPPFSAGDPGAKPSALLAAGLDEHRHGRLDTAARLYGRVLQLVPAHPDALALLGVLHYQRGAAEQALDLLQQAVESAPDHVDALTNLALVQRSAGDLDGAQRSLNRALRVEPDLPAAINSLGSVLLDRGELDGAIAHYRRAAALAPDYVEVLVNLANALLLAGHAAEGRGPCEQAVRLRPDLADAHAMQGQLSAALGADSAATECFRRAFDLAPDSADHACRLAASLETERRWDEALEVFEQAVGLNPDHGTAISGALLLRRSLCRWQDLDVWSGRFADGVRRSLDGLTPFIYLSEPSTGAQQLACAELWSRNKSRSMAPAKSRLEFNFPRRRKDRITVAYFSHDFRRHPTAYTKVGLFENHDRERFRVLGYCNGPDDDSGIRRRVIASFDQFDDVHGWPAARIAQQVFADGVDILVDLKGHTLNAPTEVFALRPAPIQVNYKGYPGTIGDDFMDYIVVDEFVVPSAARSTCSEKTVYLPETYWVDDSRRAMPATPASRTTMGLPEAGFVYCAFNNSYKLNPALFDRWMEILRAVPDSVLWLQNSNPRSSLADNLRREAVRRDVAADRIVFAPRRPLEDYLAMFCIADLFLDARPYNAHTTASDALWCGLPVLTCPGETFASRVAGSLLRAIDMSELIMDNLDAYVRMAIDLATDSDRLRALTERLVRNRSTTPLYDTARLTRHMEAAYQQMYEGFLAGRPPEHFAVAALPPSAD